MKTFITRVLFATTLLLFASPAWAQQPRELFHGREVVASHALVKFRAVPPAQRHQIEQDEDIDAAEDVGSTGVVLVRSRSKNATALVNSLLARPEVVFAEPNYIVHAIGTPSDPSFGQLWGLQNTGQPIGGFPGTPGADISAVPAWDLSTGSRATVVAVVDTGIDYTHPDLAANVWSAPAAFTVKVGGRPITCAAGTHGFNAITKTCNPMDDNDHGTHVSGTIGAVGNNGLGVVGVNWAASIMGAKFIDASGSGTLANAINAIEFTIQAKAAFASSLGANVRVLSNSWGCYCFSQALLDEINRANANDMLFVAAAGNDGVNNDTSPLYPASFTASNVIAVAATDNTDALAWFSNYGLTTVHLGAPGVDILSTITGGAYASYSGTSMATPHVSGAAALVLSKCSLPTADLKNTILTHVDPIPSLAGLTVTGGRLDVNGALRACAAPPGPDFALSATPASQTVTVGASTTYTMTVAPSGGFTGPVSLSVTVPASSGMSASLTPSSVTTSGTSTLTVTTSSATAAGAYSLTITGTSGSLVHTATVTLIAQVPDFALSATPASQTVMVGDSTTYTVTVTPSGGFSGSVTLNVSGLPAGATFGFSPNPIAVTTPGSSTLTVTTPGSPAGTYSLTITGSSGALSHTTMVTLIVKVPVLLSVTPTTLQAGGTLTATWSGIASPTATDWLGLYVPGAADSAYLDFHYTTGAASGSVLFPISVTRAAGTYELRLFAAGQMTRLAISNTFTVTTPPPPAVTASPTTVAPGGTLTAAWSGIRTPVPSDWLGLYAPGAADTAYLAYRYTTGTASGSVPFTVPASLAPGTYELRLFSAGSYTRLATSNAFSVTGGAGSVTLSASPSSLPAGGTVTATWSGIASPTATDWLGLYAPGAADATPLTSRNTTGTASGSVPFTIPASLTPGTYELRLFSNGGSTRLATSNAFTVTAPPAGPTLSVSPTTVTTGGTVTATWSGIASPTATDWLGLYAPGAADAAPLTSQNTTGAASGSVPFAIPASLAPGTYELRLFSNGGFTRLATSNAFSVTAGGGPVTLGASPTSLQAGGTLTVTWSGITTPTASDWIGLYVPGAADSAYLDYRYTTGAASGSVPFPISVTRAAGTYELRLFSAGGFTRLATSNAFTVTTPPPPALTASPTTVAPGGTLTAAWSGIPTPVPSDWLGLYAPGAADTAYLAYRYTTGTASGSVPFTVPASLAPGTYELRLFSAGSYTRLATSNAFAVSP